MAWKRRVAIAVPLVTASSLVLAGLSGALPFVQQPTDQRVGFDPLSPKEEAEALQIAVDEVPGLVPDTVEAALTTEELLVERNDDTKAAPTARVADVYVYDYEQDVLTRTVVDLGTDTVKEVEQLTGVQLPITQDETYEATQILLADAGLADRVAAQYQAATGRPLEDATTQLRVQALVFDASTMPDRVNEAGKRCGVQRCAQLLLMTDDYAVIDLLPIINLSERTIVSGNAFFGS
jgi:Cu2+-containing amine oxidase